MDSDRQRLRCGRCGLQLGEYHVARALGTQTAFMQHPQLVSQCKRTRTMGNQQDSSAPLGEHAQRLQQRGFTCVVQMGVGFVEDNKVRLPVQRTSQRYALPLAETLAG